MKEEEIKINAQKMYVERGITSNETKIQNFIWEKDIKGVQRKCMNKCNYRNGTYKKYIWGGKR